ncbi:MAG: acetyl-CoA carboxylase biotin carboxyl carrier protein [Phycisphaerales bacterium]|nr:acetyl-CoA carboxylase biotin carboxyl carrier protein [Phycisphaerales bacterium]
MIDIRKLKELVRLMVENDLSELDLQDQQETVTIKRGATAVPVARVGSAAGAIAGEVGADDGKPEVEAPVTAAAGSASAPAAPASTAGLIPIVSPMVGTAYLTPNPDSPSFVQVGASIGPESTVCLIEAMKVFSEIKAETSGVIERVLVTNGQAVQYGQQLFLVRPV